MSLNKLFFGSQQTENKWKLRNDATPDIVTFHEVLGHEYAAVLKYRRSVSANVHVVMRQAG